MSTQSVLLKPVIITATAPDTPDALRAENTHLRALLGVMGDLIDDVDETEHPAGSNRSLFLDAMADEFGEPRGSAWCARLQAHVAKKHGQWIPTHDVGSCDEWVKQALATDRWRAAQGYAPQIGDIVVYTNGKKLTEGRYVGQMDAVHMGRVANLKRLKSIEGNTVKDKFDRNGGTCCIKAIDTSRVYGYIKP